MTSNDERKKLLLVVNPKAGKCAAKHNLFDIVSFFSRTGYEVTVYPTTKHNTSEFMKHNASRYNRIVCCGGDGTLSEVLSGVYFGGSRIPVGYIPTGSTNDYASNMGISQKIPFAAFTASNGKIIKYDLGLFNGTPFSYVAAVGAFTSASYSAPQKLKNKLGHFAYVIEGAKSIIDIKPITIKVEVNGKVIKDQFIYASVSNTTSLGGVLKLKAEDVDYSDGLFEIMLIKHPKSLKSAFELTSDLVTGNFKTKNIALIHAKRVKFSFDTPVVFSLDGEKSAPCTEAVIANHRGASRVVVPRSLNNIKDNT